MADWPIKATAPCIGVFLSGKRKGQACTRAAKYRPLDDNDRRMWCEYHMPVGVTCRPVTEYYLKKLSKMEEEND